MNSNLAKVWNLRKVSCGVQCRGAEAAEQEAQARPLVAKESEYNQACFAAICGNPEEALRLLQIALQFKPCEGLESSQG